MAKPKIIIADTDFSYIAHIQNKLIEDYYDQIELIVITEDEWYSKYFSEPQSAELLIVDETLFEEAVLRHSIGNVFVLAEDVDQQVFDHEKVAYISKYRNLREIFLEIFSKSKLDLGNKAEADKMSQIVVITSAEGGAGKTTVAAGVCVNLAKNFKRVLYINAANLQTFQFILNNREPISNLEIGNLQLADDKEIYNVVRPMIRNEIFSYFPPFSAALMSLGLSESIYLRIALAAKNAGEFDYIVIDTESSFDEKLAALLSIADKVMVIVRQNAASVFAMNTMIANINDINSEKYLFVCNQFNKDQENALIRSDSDVKVNISDYIAYVDNQNSLLPEQLQGNDLIQKTAFLLI